MAGQDPIEIRSYGVCFSLERRIHRLERWRIPLPYGIPLRGIAYFGALLAVVLLLSKLPVVGPLVSGLHPVLRFGGLPIGLAAGLLRWNVDGRHAHQMALAWLRHAFEPKRVLAFKAAPQHHRVELGEVAFAPDARSARLRRGEVTGPATVVFRYPVDARPRGRTLSVRRQGGPAQWRGTQVQLRAGQRLVVR